MKQKVGKPSFSRFQKEWSRCGGIIGSQGGETESCGAWKCGRRMSYRVLSLVEQARGGGDDVVAVQPLSCGG